MTGMGPDPADPEPEPNPADVPVRTLPLHWWRRGAVYAAAYALSVALAASAGTALYTRRLPKHLMEIVLPWSCFFVAGVSAYFACHTWAADRWLSRVIRRRAPYWYVIAAAAVSGTLVGGGLFGFGRMPDRSLALAGVMVLVAGGPLIGVLWLVHWPLRRTDPDYDDEMTSEPESRDGLIDLPDLAATEAFGRRLGGLLFPNAVVALVGPLGAGKTHLTRAVAEGLEIANPAAVTSPTFTLIHEYPARLPIYHFDAYRLSRPSEFLDLGVTEYYEAGGVCLIEWADKVEAALPAERLTIRLVPVDEDRRRAEVIGMGERYEALARELAMTSPAPP
jgi:tRNA threonylcarbamoyladenosine biosynthesis protein TsaE